MSAVRFGLMLSDIHTSASLSGLVLWWDLRHSLRVNVSVDDLVLGPEPTWFREKKHILRDQISSIQH